MKIKDLHNNQIVTCRLGRSGRTQVEWEKDPITDQEWNPKPIYVQLDKKGNPSIITLRDECWAEASPRDFHPDPEGGYFLVEDFYLQIYGLEL